jgi:hypothetical protein
MLNDAKENFIFEIFKKSASYPYKCTSGSPGVVDHDSHDVGLESKLYQGLGSKLDIFIYIVKPEPEPDLFSEFLKPRNA